MKNKHLLETKLKSVHHYASEIKRLQDAISVNEEVRSEILDSIKEFFPFDVDDILFKSDKIIKILNVNEVRICQRHEGVEFHVEYLLQDKSYGFSMKSHSRYTITEWNEWKKIN